MESGNGSWAPAAGRRGPPSPPRGLLSLGESPCHSFCQPKAFLPSWLTHRGSKNSLTVATQLTCVSLSFGGALLCREIVGIQLNSHPGQGAGTECVVAVVTSHDSEVRGRSLCVMVTCRIRPGGRPAQSRCSSPRQIKNSGAHPAGGTHPAPLHCGPAAKPSPHTPEAGSSG